MDRFLDPSPVLELALGTVGLVVVMIVHGFGVRLINRFYSSVWIRVDERTAHWRVNLLLAGVISAFTLVHLVETLMWAGPLYRLGLIPDLRNSFYFVLENYTTLGDGNVALPEPWRLIGPIIAMSGLFTFGWTGSVLVGIMTEYGKFDRSQAREARDRSSGTDGGA